MVVVEIMLGFGEKGEGFEKEGWPMVCAGGCLVETAENGVMVLVWRSRLMVREKRKVTVKERVWGRVNRVYGHVGGDELATTGINGEGWFDGGTILGSDHGSAVNRDREERREKEIGG